MRHAQHTCDKVATRLANDYAIQFHWSDDKTITFGRSGVTGQVQLLPQAVHVKVTLGL